MKKLNGRQILLHFIAALLFVYGFALLFSLTDISLFKMLEPGAKPGFIYSLTTGKVPMEEFNRYVFYTTTSWIWGLAVAFLFSLGITLKKRWFWMDPAIAFLLAFLVCKHPLSNQYPGWHTTIFMELVPWSVFWHTTIGLLSIAAALGVFFSKKANNFITRAASRLQ
jgi:hypothetical protein